MRILHILCLSLLLFSPKAFSATGASTGDAQLIDIEAYTEVVIRGRAADILYEVLAKKEGAVITSCGAKTSVVVPPMNCMKSPGGSVACHTTILANDSSFSAPDVCNAPQLSIIGVGNIDELPSKPATGHDPDEPKIGQIFTRPTRPVNPWTPTKPGKPSLCLPETK